MIFLGFSGLPLPVTRGDNFRGVVEPGHARGRRSENFCCSAQKQLDPNAAPPISASMLQCSKTVSASRGYGTARPGQEDRTSVGEGKRGSVRVGLGGRRSIKKKKKETTRK